MGGNGSLPSLSELLTKSVAELSEEVITLKLELETEKRSIYEPAVNFVVVDDVDYIDVVVLVG